LNFRKTSGRGYVIYGKFHLWPYTNYAVLSINMAEKYICVTSLGGSLSYKTSTKSVKWFLG
jgi:hypothetical protein